MSETIAAASQGAKTYYGLVNEDGSFSVLARLTSLDGSGDQVQPREGNCLTQDDVLSITCKIFDLGTDKDNEAGTPLSPDPTVTVSDSIFDTLRTVGWPTDRDYAGYNFRHDIEPTYVPTGGNWYLLEYKISLSGGGTSWLRVKVKALAVQTS